LDIETYLKRINYEGPRPPTAETLRALHLAHLFNVPFENLDIHLGNPLTLNEADLYEKIVVRGRGGFCYELNGMFAWLLQEMGFDVSLLSARVSNSDGGFGPEFDHLTLRVSCPADPIMPAVPWLADVGFGECFMTPLRLDWLDREQDEAGPHTYRIREKGTHLSLWEKRGYGEWEEQYRFTLQPRQLPEFNGMCRYHQTSPASHFTRQRVCSRAIDDGRITLSEKRLIITGPDQRRERPVLECEYRAILEKHFGVRLDQTFLAKGS
jgi:N-hydroxyarylamine O-acetyltransferase